MKAGALVWVPDDGERGIVMAMNDSKTKALVCFAAWKNGAENNSVPDDREQDYTMRRISRSAYCVPHLPDDVYICWYDVEHLAFSPPPWEDRAGFCADAYPDDELLLVGRS